MVSAPVTVMLVDTDPVYRAGVRARLEAVGFAVAEAADASDAVRVAHELQPEVCLVDIGGSPPAGRPG